MRRIRLSYGMIRIDLDFEVQVVVAKQDGGGIFRVAPDNP